MFARPRVDCFELRFVSLDREECYAGKRLSLRSERCLRAFRGGILKTCSSGPVNDMHNTILVFNRPVGTQWFCSKVNMSVPIHDEFAMVLIEALDPGQTGLGVTFLVRQISIRRIVPGGDDPIILGNRSEEAVEPALHDIMARSVPVAANDIYVAEVIGVKVCRAVYRVYRQNPRGILVKILSARAALEFMIACRHEKLPTHKNAVNTGIMQSPLPGSLAPVVSEISRMNLEVPVGNLVEQDVGNIRAGVFCVFPRISPEGYFYFLLCEKPWLMRVNT